MNLDLYTLPELDRLRMAYDEDHAPIVKYAPPLFFKNQYNQFQFLYIEEKTKSIESIVEQVDEAYGVSILI